MALVVRRTPNVRNGELPRPSPQSRWPTWLQRLAAVGADPTDSEELRVRKTVLVLSASLMAALATVWVITYAALGLLWSSAIPFVYEVASTVSIATFAHTRRYRFFRRSQLVMTLVLPFALQWSLGGFENSSAVALWGFTAPLGALLFVGATEATPSFAAFVALVIASGVLDPALADKAPHIPSAVIHTFFVLNVIGVAGTAFVLTQYFVRSREREQQRSERLLLNVLPAPVAARLKDNESVIADSCPTVSVLFADIVGFTPLAERLDPHDLVDLLDHVFASWDALAAQHHVEKIKTIGDAYMVAAGVPVPRDDHAHAVADMALAMRPALARVATDAGLSLEVRIGIDTGPVVAGVIGRTKFSYDLWGDTVNTASRMESHAQPGTIQVSQSTFDRLRDSYKLRPRGTIDIKGKSPQTTYLLLGRERS